jgi:hypothetical protein
MSKKAGNRSSRQPYRKMRMEGVQLVAEEAVLTFCKVPGSGPSGGKVCGLGGGACNKDTGS